MAELDLDARRAARAEARREPHKVVIGGKTFSFPPVMTVAAADAAQKEDVGGIIRGLLGKKADAFLALGFDTDDFTILVRELYGVSTGESRTSGPSSPIVNNGTPSRPTSNGPTDETSARTAMAEMPSTSEFDASVP